MTNQRLKDLYNSKYFWMFISLLVSVFLWIYITNVEETTIKETYRNIRVEFEGEEQLREKGLIISQVDTASVTATISGKSREMAKFDASDLKAVIDVSLIGRAGEYQYGYAIEYPSGVDYSTFKEESTRPEQVAFTVQREATKTVEVKGLFIGSAAEGFVVDSDQMIFEPATITVYGTAEELSQISYAQVTIDAKDISSTIHEDRPYVFMNASGEEVEVLHASTEVELIATTVPVNMLKEVELVVDIIPGGGAYDFDCDIDIDPETVTLSGSTDELETMSKLTVGTPIELADYITDFELTFPLTLDEGIECVSGETEVTVSVKFNNLVTKAFDVTDMDWINLPEGAKAGIVNKTLSVLIRSDPETIEKISAEDISVIADLADYATVTGYVTVPVKIYIDGVTGAGAVGDYSITINLTT